ncbi:hypothetical protein CRYUN_Cryun20dG0022900 [Craigia yunnanensis]
MMPDKKNHVMWTAMVAGYSQNCEAFKAIECYQDLVVEGVELNQFTFPSVLTACAAVQAGNFGAQVHSSIVMSDFEAKVFVQSALVDIYAKCRDLDSAMRVLENMKVDDVVSWNSMIVREAGYAHNDCHEEVLKLFCDMRMAGIYLDHVASILSACAELTVLEFGQQVHANFVKSGLQSSLSVDNSLVTIHAGLLETGRSYFASMEKVYGAKPGSEHYACMIDLLGRLGKLFEAESLLNQMDVEPDATIWRLFLRHVEYMESWNWGKEQQITSFN